MKSPLVLFLILIFNTSLYAANFVTNNFDSGSGSLRQSLLDYTFDKNTAIIISPSVKVIKLYSPLKYNSYKPLRIVAPTGLTLYMEGKPNECLSIDNNVMTYIYGVTFVKAGMVVKNNTGGSASRMVSIVNCIFNSTNGSGLTVTDNQVGKLTINLSNVSFLACQSRGASILKFNGLMNVDMQNIGVFLCGAVGNGDGIQVCVHGSDLLVNANMMYMAFNNEDNLELEETGGGSAIYKLSNIWSYYAGEENLEMSEQDMGDLTVYINNIHTYGYNILDTDRNDGVEIREEDEGNVFVDIRNSSMRGSEYDGLRIIPDFTGNVLVKLAKCVIEDNGDDGLDYEGQTNGDGITFRGFTNLNIEDCVFRRNGLVSQQRGNAIRAVSSRFSKANILRITGKKANYQGDLDLEGSFWQLKNLARSLK